MPTRNDEPTGGGSAGDSAEERLGAPPVGIIIGRDGHVKNLPPGWTEEQALAVGAAWRTYFATGDDSDLKALGIVAGD